MNADGVRSRARYGSRSGPGAESCARWAARSSAWASGIGMDGRLVGVLGGEERGPVVHDGGAHRAWVGGGVGARIRRDLDARQD
eukprot:7004843-Pyramimonas_sp.AAC.1